jgi:hypothetical protein
MRLSYTGWISTVVVLTVCSASAQITDHVSLVSQLSHTEISYSVSDQEGQEKAGEAEASKAHLQEVLDDWEGKILYQRPCAIPPTLDNLSLDAPDFTSQKQISATVAFFTVAFEGNSWRPRLWPTGHAKLRGQPRTLIFLELIGRKQAIRCHSAPPG